MKVKVTKKQSNTIELRDTIYKITLYSKNSDELKCATDLVRENIHHYLSFTVDTAYADYMDNIIILSDSMSYPKVFSDRPEGTEVVEVVRGFNAKTTEADMLEIIMKSIIQSRHDYPEVAFNWEMYKAGNEMPATKSAEDKEEATAPEQNAPTAYFANPTAFINPDDMLTDSANYAYKDIVELICMLRYGNVNYDKLKEFHDHIVGVIIFDAYHNDVHHVTLPCGYILVSPKLPDGSYAKYGNKKVGILANYIMALVFISGGDCDFDVEAVSESTLTQAMIRGNETVAGGNVARLGLSKCTCYRVKRPTNNDENKTEE